MIESFMIETNMVHTIEMKRERISEKENRSLFRYRNESLYNEFDGSKINERGGWNYNWILI